MCVCVCAGPPGTRVYVGPTQSVKKPLPFPGNGDQPKTPFIASKSKSRLVTPLFYGGHLKFMVGHSSPLK